MVVLADRILCLWGLEEANRKERRHPAIQLLLQRSAVCIHASRFVKGGCCAVLKCQVCYATLCRGSNVRKRSCSKGPRSSPPGQEAAASGTSGAFCFVDKTTEGSLLTVHDAPAGCTSRGTVLQQFFEHTLKVLKPDRTSSSRPKRFLTTR